MLLTRKSWRLSLDPCFRRQAGPCSLSSSNRRTFGLWGRCMRHLGLARSSIWKVQDLIYKGFESNEIFLIVKYLWKSVLNWAKVCSSPVFSCVLRFMGKLHDVITGHFRFLCSVIHATNKDACMQVRKVRKKTIPAYPVLIAGFPRVHLAILSNRSSGLKSRGLLRTSRQ